MTCKSRLNLGFSHKSPKMPGEYWKLAVQLKNSLILLSVYKPRLDQYIWTYCDETCIFSEVAQGTEDVPLRHFTKKKGTGHPPIRSYYYRKPGKVLSGMVSHLDCLQCPFTLSDVTCEKLLKAKTDFFLKLFFLVLNMSWC